jgi:hypothetical protein
MKRESAITAVERIVSISKLIYILPDPNKAKILEFVISYMIESRNQITNQTDGYIAFMEGLESAIIEYKGE